LADKAIKDKLTRILLMFGACAGLCYNALWYFPVLIVIGGITTLVWDIFLQQKIGKLRAKWRRRKSKERSAEEDIATESIALEEPPKVQSNQSAQKRAQAAASKDHISIEEAGPSSTSNEKPSRSDAPSIEDIALVADTTTHGIRVKLGLTIIAAFLRMYLLLLLLI
jgi:hypothetical protein